VFQSCNAQLVLKIEQSHSGTTVVGASQSLCVVTSARQCWQGHLLWVSACPVASWPGVCTTCVVLLGSTFQHYRLEGERGTMLTVQCIVTCTDPHALLLVQAYTVLHMPQLRNADVPRGPAVEPKGCEACSTRTHAARQHRVCLLLLRWILCLMKFGLFCVMLLAALKNCAMCCR
jgi:hypothetical protein